MKNNLYDLLGVSKNANDKEIKAAYRKKALKYHPDRYATDSKAEKDKAENKFKEINEAYTILSNPEKKQAYDQYGDPNAGGSPFGQSGFQGDDFPDLNDILNSFFGGGRQGSQSPSKGDDLAYTLTLTLEEAASGIEKEIALTKKEACDGCQGSGSKAGSQPVKCSTCHGSGKITMQQGFMAIQHHCSSCRGEGVKITNPCQKCHGKGICNQNSTVKIRIPAGVDTNDRMRVPHKGAAGVRNAPSGDLYININVSKHALFSRDGVNLHCDVPISFYQACAGGEIEVATLNNTVVLKIPPETQSGSQLRLRHKGIKSVKTNQTGDIICHIIIETPIKLSALQKTLIEKFDDSLQKSQRHQPKTQSFIERIKRMFGA